MKYAKFLIISGLLSAFLVGCGGDSKEEAKAPDVPPPAPAPAPVEPAATPEATSGEAAGASTVASSEPAPPAAPEPLTDEQIAAVTDAANTGEIEQAKLAEKKAKNPRVKKFAAHMIQQHTQAKQKQAKWATKAKLTPATSPVSTQITEDGSKLLETLKGSQGADFDKAYIDAQVDEHKKVLEAFDTQLIPNAKNADLKASLEEFRPKVEEHLKQAQDIQQALANAPAEPAGGKGGAATGASGSSKGAGASGSSTGGASKKAGGSK